MRSGTGASATEISYHLRTASSRKSSDPGRTSFDSCAYPGRTFPLRSRTLLIVVPPEVADEVCLPGLAAVLGEGLLPARRRRRHTRPGVADEDVAALERVRALEDPDVTVEPADHRRLERAGVAAIGPVDRPELRLGIEEAERHAHVAARVVGEEHVLVGRP